jgi:hypothetical protein
MTTLEKLEELVYHGFKETDKRLEVHRLETEKLKQETEKARQETDKARQETDKARQETDKALRKLTRDISRLTTDLTGLTDSLGRFAESAVYPAVARLFRERGIELADTYWRIGDRRNGHHMEIDVLGAGPQHVVLMEVKLKLKLEHVQDLLQKLENFFVVFPYYRGRALYGAVAGMSIDKDVDRYAYHRGLFVMAQTGENLRILNDKKFIPRQFPESVEDVLKERKDV